MAAVRLLRFSSAALLAISVLAAHTAAAGDRFGPIAPPGQQFMLYVSRSVGAAGRPQHVYGLKFERTSSAAIDASTRFAAPLRHRTLIDLQFSRRATARLQLGARATWDMGLRRLGPTADLVDSPWRPDSMASLRKPDTRLP